MRRATRWLAAVMTLGVVLAGCARGPDDKAEDGTPERWQLVWFSDSAPWGVSADWARTIEKKLDVKVEVLEHLEFGAGGAAKLLEKIESDPSIRREIAGAEIVVVYATASDTGIPEPHNAICYFGSYDQPSRQARLSQKELTSYRKILTTIYDRVFTLRGGEPTIVRALDTYVPVITDWRKAGVYQDCTAGWEAAANTHRDVAAEFGVPMASLYDAFNGPNHDRDPVAPGLIGSDGIHTSEKGKALVRATLDALGYEPIAR
jgi:lysophospholipase L1-like esterase